MSEKDRSGEAKYASQPSKDWVVSLLGEGQIDDESVSPEHRLLLTMFDHAERRSMHIDDFLALLERQARGTAAEQDTRQRQFTGLLDLLAVVARDEELLAGLRELEPEVAAEERDSI
jgi:hypothetical protein